MITVYLGKTRSRRFTPLACSHTGKGDFDCEVEITTEQLTEYLTALNTVQRYQTKFRRLRRYDWMVRV